MHPRMGFKGPGVLRGVAGRREGSQASLPAPSCGVQGLAAPRRGAAKVRREDCGRCGESTAAGRAARGRLRALADLWRDLAS